METLSTKYGTFIPQFTANDLRQKEILPITYHDNGIVKSLPLEEQTMVSTSVGDIPAELMSFHENGSLNRIFPLNGKLSGYWGQDDEAALAKPVALNTPAGIIDARIIGVSFYDNEAIRSVTLWPGEVVSISTSAGFFETRIGICFTPDGEIKSLEPAKPTPVETLAGEITAYDPDAVGVNGDDNSLVFDNNGDITRVTTTLSKLKAVHPNGSTSIFVPATRESLCGDTEEEVVPMVIELEGQAITVQTDCDLPPTIIPKESHLFFTEPYLPQLANPLEMIRCSI